MHKVVMGQNDIMIQIDMKDSFWNILKTVAVGLVVAAVAILAIALTAGIIGVVAAPIMTALAALGIGGGVSVTLGTGAVILASSAGIWSAVTYYNTQLPNNVVLPTYTISPEEIFEGKILLFDVDFFNPVEEIKEKKDAQGNTIHYYIDENGEEIPTSTQNTALELQKVVSQWYMALRNIAIVLSMSVLLYTGIRMLLSTIAQDKAKYKQMIADWIVGLCLLFFMHYIMAFSVTVVKQFSKMIVYNQEQDLEDIQSYTGVIELDEKGKIKEKVKDVGQEEAIQPATKIDENGQEVDTECLIWPTNIMGQLRIAAQMSYGDAGFIGYTICFFILVLLTIFFTFVYLKRVLYMAFLTMIAPLVALTYPIDKISDGQAQGFNRWLKEYIFNLIDTPGHVDFNYEVSRSLAACEGAILVVDAAQGIEAQTLANVYLAIDHDLEIMPVINKIDLPSAEPDRVVAEIEDVIGIEAEDAPQISAKNGINIDQVLEQIVKKIPAPGGSPDNPLQALIFDSVYDSYKGVIVFARIMEGTIKKGTNMLMMATGAKADVVEVGTFGAGQFIPCDELSAGMVGYITASLKNVKDTRVGDTVTDADNPCAEPLPGYKKVNPMVFCGVYPADGAKYPDLRDALEKLQLNDAALQYEPETSVALGFGFRCGFLGLLHLEIVQERLEREYNLDLVTTAPSVIYKVHLTDGTVFDLTNPTNLPDPSTIDYMEEPIVSAEIMVTKEYVGSIMKLCQERRGVYVSMEYMEETRALLKYELPLNEIIYDFFDALKSRSRGYASFDYEMKGYVQSDLVKLDILLNRENVDALSFIVHASSAYERGRKMCEKLKEEIPRHLFEIPIQAAIGSKIIARETVKAVRKDVLAKCYGGDISRKKKLLEKQKEGKKRMRQIGNVEIPQKAFMSVLKLDED